MALLKTIRLGQTFGERGVLEDINLEINRGEFFALIGPSGAGKTTLLQIIDLLQEPACGQLYFDGQLYPQSGQARLNLRRRMAFVLQKPAVFNGSVRDNIAIGLRWRGVDRDTTIKKTDELLEIVNLSELRDNNARTLSGGEAQRVAIARAVITEPELLLLDEPAANLDRVAALHFEELLRNIVKQYHPTVIMSTHDLSRGRRLADRIGVLVEGRLEQVAAAEEIFSYPENREVAEFIGTENIIPGTVAGVENGITMVELSGHTIEAVAALPPGAPVYACLRAEAVTLSTRLQAESSARNRLRGTLRSLQHHHPLALAEIDCGFPLLALVTGKSVADLELTPGAELCVSFKATAVHLIPR
jgi:tungstate transport system ATP-binding protein